ncbi:hypothetical protein GP486_005679 [Trichoglossum hirsutum]|uniref:Chromo domain-containing protein n=1 Tax=Trichoglossum hirsutum TaxID=265104 RepID=A0A9P8L8R2_9PEZI|nr:hypothetical protein GP486_005679 [Trichoglossum hirsutum]
MTEYGRLLHASSSEPETPTTAPGPTFTPDRKLARNSGKKKKLQRPESLVSTARINYLRSPMLIEPGDWVVRLRDGDPMTMAKLDENDIWDGPFPVVELPPATGDEGDDVNVTASPVKEIPRVKLRFPQGSKGDPWTSVNRLIPAYPDPPRLGGDAAGCTGMVFHLRKGSSTFVELQRHHPRSKKDRELYIVGRLRGRRLIAKNAELEYLVHWAGWPSEDDSWEKMSGIPESFREEYEKAKSGKKPDDGNKASKAKKGAITTAGRGPSTSVVVKDEATETGKKTSTPAAVAKDTPLAPTARNTNVRRGASAGDPQAASTPGLDIPRGGRATTPERTVDPSIATYPPPQSRTKPRTPRHAAQTQKPTTLPITPLKSRILGKRLANAHTDPQISPEDVVARKRRRISPTKKRTEA